MLLVINKTSYALLASKTGTIRIFLVYLEIGLPRNFNNPSIELSLNKLLPAARVVLIGIWATTSDLAAISVKVTIHFCEFMTFHA